MKALIMPNIEKQNAKECCQNVIEEFKRLEIDVLMSEKYKGEIPAVNAVYLEFYKALEECDILIAIGGDGTILHSAKHAVEVDKPLLGINVGRLGFMAGLEEFELPLLAKLKEGAYNIQERMLLSCTHFKSGGESRVYNALNDIVVSNGTLSRIIELDVACDGKHMTSTRADGLIFSTPTGSTAYALSAGGPVISPTVNCISLTPICPHSLLNRTVIFKEDNVLTVSCSPKNRHTVYLTADGDDGAALEKGDCIEVRKSEKSVKLISLSDKSFYHILSDKFRL